MISEVRTHLLDWYGRYGRSLPWRGTGNAYHTWVSEIMLQQTRVSQAQPYYHRFLNRFPTVLDLAEAKESDVLKHWEGLGYYSRARNLHAASKQVATEHGGRVPNQYDQIRALKGVGEYTAAAIASIAFGLPYAVVDGNVFRILSRIFGVETPIDSAEGKKEFSALAQEILDKNNPSDFNQAMMDFGAIQCTPKKPKCAICPVQELCVALSLGRQGSLPVKRGKRQPSELILDYFLIYDQHQFLIRRRGNNGIWKGLYDLPGTERASITNSPILPSGLELKNPQPILALKHKLTHRNITAHFHIEQCKRLPPTDDYIRITPLQIADLPFSKLMDKFFKKYFDIS